MIIKLDSNYDYSKIDKSNIKKLGKEKYTYNKIDTYAPNVFYYMRQFWGCDENEYIDELSELNGGKKGAGKSGMLMWISKNRKYLLKTITYYELNFFLKFIDKYYNYMKSNPNSLLSKFYGIYYIDKKYVIVMNNVFYNAPSDLWVYDLKGSRRHRTIDDNINQNNVLKDNNFGNISIFIQNRKWINQINKDSIFLRDLDSMDYSLIIGISENKKKIKYSYSNFNTTINGPPPVFCNKKIVVYCGIIDFLQEYNLYKKAESFIKTKRISKVDLSEVSAIPSKPYQIRFIRFMKQHFIIKQNKYTKKKLKNYIKKYRTKRKN